MCSISRNKFFYPFIDMTWGTYAFQKEKNAAVHARVRRKRAKDRECGSAYDGRFPVGWIKNSVLKRPRARDNPLSRGTEGRPFRREGTHNAWGVCLLVCPIYTATASVRENWCVALSLPFLSSPSDILLLARAFLASFSPSCAPRPTNIGVDKPPMYCETLRVIPANRGTAWRFYYEKAKR